MPKKNSGCFVAGALPQMEDISMVDYPVFPRDYNTWPFWPGMENTQIPADATIYGSGIWQSDAPRSAGWIPITIHGENIKIYKVFGFSKNLAMGPNLPEGPWAACSAAGQDCANSYSRFMWPPRSTPTGLAELKLEWYFTNWSGDYARVCCWAALISLDHARLEPVSKAFEWETAGVEAQAPIIVLNG